MFVITVILALLIMGCRSDKEDTEISTDQVSDLELPCSDKFGLLSYPEDPDSQECHLPYRQGPCNYAEILVPADIKSTGKCKRNLCEADGYVVFEFGCYELNTEGPCKPENGRRYIFVVNPYTLKLQCHPKFILNIVIVFLVGCTSQEESSKEESNRVPVFVPGRCPENQLLYPGEEKNDWLCDCGPGYLYYPTADGCFLAYRQGPCQVKEILVLPKNSTTSECVANLCENDGFVKYKGECYELNTQGPCKSTTGQKEKFAVNQTTLEVECLLNSGDLLNLIKFPRNCPPGSIRSRKRCRPIF